MKFFILTLFLLISLSGNVYSQSFPNPATLSTGQGSIGSIDPIWVVSPWYSSNPPNPMGLSYSSAVINNNCAPGSWVDPAALPPPVNNGNWISSSGTPCTGNTGYLYFRLPLNLPADCNGNSVTTAGNYTLYLTGYVDNGISDVFINGNSTGISGGGFSPGTQLNITLVGPWVVGVNYVDVLVYNGGGPYGLLLVANSTASSTADSDGDGISDLNDLCPCLAGPAPDGCPAFTGDTIICKGESTTLAAVASGTYLWNTGSTDISITVSPVLTTPYNVIITDSNNNKDTVDINVTVNQLPVVSITGDAIICEGESIILTASGGGTYVWNTGSTNVSISDTPALSTNYKVVVTDVNSCIDSTDQAVTVLPKPEADFTFVNKCDGTAVPFNNISTISSPGTMVSWGWEFGDNTFNSDSSSSHIYSNPGNYTAYLVVTSNSSCSDTTSQQITVFSNPTASFTHSDVCFGDTVNFTNTSTANLPASISGYLWTFGENNLTGTQEHINHYYSNAGTYSVSLVTTTTDGCADTATVPVNTFDPPNNGFTFNNDCLSDSTGFTNISQNPVIGSIASWSWDFGDGSALNTTAWDINHLYAAAGNYPVTLITYSSNLGCSDTLQNTITVFPKPVADFDFIDVCLNQQVNFNDLSSVSSGSIADRSWDFGDGSVLSSAQDPGHTYLNPGTYSVILIVTTNNSCKDTITKNVVVHPFPLAQFSALNVCDGNSIQFNDLSGISSTDTIQAWTWNFGDNSSLNSNQSTAHLYAGAGSYTVQLLTVSTFGCADSITKTSVVNPNPVVIFAAGDTLGCAPLCISFQDFSTLATGTIASSTWNLGDGNLVNNSLLFDHCYSNNSAFLPGYFDVSLTVISDSGCVSSLLKTNYITVYPNPEAGFKADPQTTTITDPVISITDLSAGATFWNWTFGDGSVPVATDVNTPSGISPLPYTYADTGTYIIMLITATQYGCVDTAKETIIIEPDFVFYIPNAFSPNDDGVNDTFSGKGIFISKYEMRIFDRWGNLIFFSDDVDKPWDGKVNLNAKDAGGGPDAQIEVYVYSIRVTDFSKHEHNYKGIVTLVR